MDLSMENIKEGSILKVYHKLTGENKYKYIKLLKKEDNKSCGWHKLQNIENNAIIVIENEWFRQRKWESDL